MRRSLPGTLKYEEVKRFQDDFSFYFSLREYRCMKSSPGLERRYRMLEMLESFLNDEMGPSQPKAPQFYGVKAPIYPKSQKPSKLCPLVCVGNPYTWIIRFFVWSWTSWAHRIDPEILPSLEASSRPSPRRVSERKRSKEDTGEKRWKLSGGFSGFHDFFIFIPTLWNIPETHNNN